MTVDRSAVGRMSKSKGNRAELKIAKAIAECIGVPYEECRRTPASGALIERADLRLSPRARRLFPFFIEVKHREGWDVTQVFNGLATWKPHQWFIEAVDKEKKERHSSFHETESPVMLVLLRNRRKTLVMVDAATDVMHLTESTVAIGVAYVLYEMDAYLAAYKERLRKLEEFSNLSTPW